MTPTTRPQSKPTSPPRSAPPTNQVTTRGTPASLLMAEPIFQPPRIIINAVEGFGKTTAGAYAPKPAILMARGENGYLTLLGNHLVPQLPAATIVSWEQLLATLEQLINQDEIPFKTLVLDALNGFERLCHEYVCKVEFNNDWGDKGFMSYHKGYDVAVTHWLQLIQLLDRFHENGIMVILLEHCKVTTFKNPMGPDYDKYSTACHEKTMAVTRRWADALLFGTFYTSVETDRSTKAEVLRKGKGIGDSSRIVYTERRDAFDAKNRYNMPEIIDIPADPAQSWSAIWDHIKPQK